ncbi:carboxylesterase, type B [Actinomadura sp. KC216]|uniref:carboxylesterase/lipase family protein n=1 Tax=Actinomadura sp. KC216 TaxID=2530370 RepID=UPI001045D03D|nr:carboxylesterase family protein [Actinomadura sp. KC216]TDB89243.1 carboxylesterase, type B [Actinomadura sp. KC216]
MEPKKLRWPAIAAAAAAAMMFTAPASQARTSPQSTTHAEAAECAPGTTVQTDKGPVCGTVSGGVASWLGIRYAAPPVGELRWAPPAPAPAWTSTFPATERGTNCPQADGLGAGSTNEDCLNLNVRAPENAGAKRLPVMVQIHGGGFRFGTPADGSHLVRSGNVVSVEVHYRLGIFGFMAHRDLGRNSGNYAFQDQQAALRWVQRNIARFGGDPGNVTIYGASAGGSSVCANTVSPTAKGLFHKGISQSGEYNSLLGTNTSWQPQDCKSELPTAEQAHRTGDRFAAAVGCGDAADTAACLRRVPVQTLLDKSGNGMGPDQGTIAPIVDGKTLTMSPAKAFATGRVNDVTLIHGVDRDETQLASANTPADYQRMVREQYGRYAPHVFARYPLDRFPEPSAFIAYRTIVADSNSVCPSLLNHRRMSRHMTVYAYQSDNSDAPPASFLDQTKPNGAFHVLLNQFLSPRPGANLSPNQKAFGAQITAQWTGFARTGNPTVKGAPFWPKFTSRAPDVMSLAPAGDSELTREIGRQHHCDFWDRLTPYNR